MLCLGVFVFNLTIVSLDALFIRLIFFTFGGFTSFTFLSYLLVYSLLWVKAGKDLPTLKAF